MLHHLGVIIMLWAIAEYQLFPIGGEWPWQTSLALSNVGVQWVGDVYMNAIFFAPSLAELKRARSVQLSLSPFRILNMAIFLSTSSVAIKAKSWVAVLITTPMTLGYTYGNWNIIQWTWKFDPVQYHATHQAVWLAQLETASLDSETAKIDGSVASLCATAQGDGDKKAGLAPLAAGPTAAVGGGRPASGTPPGGGSSPAGQQLQRALQQPAPAESLLPGHGRAQASQTGGAELQQQPRTSTRDGFWDAAKFVLVACVVYNHLEWVTDWWTPPCSVLVWRMPGISFISGLFGASTSFDSLSRVACSTVGACIMVSLFYSVIRWVVLALSMQEETVFLTRADRTIQFGFNPHFVLPPHLWYLAALAVWRLVVTPCFKLCRDSLMLGKWGAAAIIYVAAYLLRHSLHRPEVHFAVSKAIPTNMLYFLNFFLFGLLLSAKPLKQILSNRFVFVLSAVIMLAYNLGLILSPRMSGHFAETVAHFPKEATNPNISMLGFLKDTADILVRQVLSLAVLSLLCGLYDVCGMRLPAVIRWLEDRGPATAYVYELHPLLFDLVVPVILAIAKITGLLKVPAMLLGALAIVLVTSAPIVRRCMRFAVEPLWLRMPLDHLKEPVK